MHDYNIEVVLHSKVIGVSRDAVDEIQTVIA